MSSYLHCIIQRRKSLVNQEMKRNLFILVNHHVRNNFLLISVVAVLIYVRAHVNVPFHHLHYKLIMFHREYRRMLIVRAHHQFIHRPIVVRKCESFLDFLLSTDYRHPSSSGYLYYEGRQSSSTRHVLILIVLFAFFPFGFATHFPSSSSLTTLNREIFFFDQFSLNNSASLPMTSIRSRTPQWHAGCCLESKRALISNCNNTSIFSFDNLTNSLTISNPYQFDFLNNETLFCRRYQTFRHVSHNYLALFTYVIVIIGIILNTFVFLVLMCGSLRRSNSFVLFLALTIFDLLSLASSLFASLFRTVMTYLKTSAPFCKMFGIFFLYFRQCSSSTLLLIAIERCIVIKYPFCRHTFDRLRLPLLALIMFIFVAPIPFDFIFYTSGSLHCEAFDTIQADHYQIFRGFFTVFSYALVPFVGISISNFLIIIELKKSKERFLSKNEDGEIRRFSTNVVDKRGTTVMLLVASFAFLLLLGPFYIHWCIAYLFFNYPQCHFTRNLYENVQVCMGVFHPYITVIEKGMRESNHAINFLLYWATSTRFRLDFKRLCRRLIFGIFASTAIYLYKHLCVCCPEPSCLHSLEQHVSDIVDQDSSYEFHRKHHTAYQTAHYYSNFERRRQQQLVQATLLNSNLSTDAASLTPTPSLHTLTANTAKTVRMLTWNPHDPFIRQLERKRQAERLSRKLSESGTV